MNKAFTFIEILVVVTIISVLTAVGAASYASVSKNSRDARRKADLEEIRAAVELYRSTNNSYPSAITAGSAITDVGGSTYMQKVPKDPKDPNYTYRYTPVLSGTVYNDYTLGAYLEGGGTACSGSPSCTVGVCNYCLGPYGQK